MFSRVLMALLLAGVPTLANATLIGVLQSGPTLITTGPFAGDFAFNYIAKLSGDERLDPAATDSVTCPGLGHPVQCNPGGTFFTIYDIPGLAEVNITAANWSSVTQSLGVTPSTIDGSSFDDPTLENVTFSYTGPVVHANGTDLLLSGFQIISTFKGLNLNGTFTSQATKDTGDSNGSTDQVVGLLPVPAVPEPATLLLVGGGLASLAVVGIRRPSV
jgi:hypothetical protein